MQHDIDLNNLQDTTPQTAPVADPEPLTGKEKAGVYLTWGIIAVLVGFLIIILAIFAWGENQFMLSLEQLETLNASASPEHLQKLTELTSEVGQQQSNFRTFWFDTLQLILINVLFPTLTALLGYVFGTSKNNN